MKRIVIDPVTRISGLLGVEVDIDGNKVVDARVSGGQFRGLEKMLKGRNPLDVVYLVSRVCGICSTHHMVASVMALEDMMNITPNFNGKVARDIANGFEFLQNHIRQIYLFVMADFVKLQNSNPVFIQNKEQVEKYKVPKRETERINNRYLEALKYSREAHKAIAILTGKAPHGHGIFLGGVTNTIDVQQIVELKFIITRIKQFVKTKMLEDIYTVAECYKEYFKIGQGYCNFMDFGLFNSYSDKSIVYSSLATLINNKKGEVNINSIKESLTSSWLESDRDEIRPGAGEVIKVNLNKPKGYSWVTAPRYDGLPIEGGPIARMIINGYYKNNVSVLDRLIARVLEAGKISESLEALIELLQVNTVEQKVWNIPKNGKGLGLLGAARGNLAHFIEIKNGLIENYSLLPPSNWNLSPADSKGVKGPVEFALIGTEIEDLKNPVEIGRIIRSFDPCLNCAAHITTKGDNPIKINVL